MCGIIIVCRYDSKRLPGKVLREINGRPLLDYIMSRCRQVNENNNNIIIATSTRDVDIPIVQYCNTHHIPYFRGSADDVAGRVLACALSNKWKYFFRVNADSPFVDPSLMKNALNIALSSDYDIITNLYPRSFPYGVSIELIKTDTFKNAYTQMCSADYREHVTLFLYQNMEKYRYFNIVREGDNLKDFRLTVDTKEDFNQFEYFISHLEERWDTVSYVDAVNLLQTRGTIP